MSLYLAILAGGESSRTRGTDSTPPKQFREVGGQMLLLHGARELLRAPGVVHLTVVVPEPWRPTVDEALREAALPVPYALAPAGVHRTASAWHAVQAIAALGARADDLVAIHDAARPFATHHLLARVAEAAAHSGAAIPAVAVTDTIVQLAEESVYLERDLLAAVQTPQVFRFADLREAHAWCAETGASFTDDGSLLASRGLRPAVVMGEDTNWKITTDADWQRAVARLT